MTNLMEEQFKQASELAEASQWNIGKVDDVRESTADNPIPHAVRVSIRGQDSRVWMPVLVPQHGDINIPLVNSMVLVGAVQGDRHFAIPIYESDQSIGEYAPGERVVSHPLSSSKVHLKEDGTMVLSGDGDATITLKPNDDVVIDTPGDVHLGGEGGSPVAREGDSVSVDPDTGDGSITGGSSNVNSE